MHFAPVSYFSTHVLELFHKFSHNILCMNSIDRFVLHLSLISGVGIETIRRIVSLLDRYTIEEIYQFSSSYLQKVTFFSEKKASCVVNGLSDKQLLEKEEAQIEKSCAFYISFCNAQYPKLLLEIDSPPPILYYKGKHFSAYEYQPMIAVVGSRQGNHYARQVVNQFVPELVKRTICIVSGGAFGVDSMAHKAALQSHGNTIVVLGSGLLHVYPYQNKNLFDAIIKSNGTVVSSFAMDTQPLAHNFPARNRIISGLSLATVIVQAAAKSGAYITAQCALEQGRDVFAVPGSIFDPLSAGCHALLSQGAQLADSAESIIRSYFVTDIVQNQMEKEDSVVAQCQKRDESLGVVAATILQKCINPMFLQELSELIDTIDIVSLQKEVCSLQLKGKLKQDVSGAFITVKL